MGKAAKSKREEKAVAKAEEGDYTFKLPTFDEQAFIRREILSARASFYTLGLGVAAGVASILLALTALPWSVGWLPIFVAILALRPLLSAMKFPEEVWSWKALLGSYFMLFFTALAIWMLGVNVV